MGWTLKEMSARSGIPISTLAKIERDQLTLTYDKLQQLSSRLSIRPSDLFVEEQEPVQAQVIARRSIGRVDQAVVVNTPNYDYHYLCTELRRKRMIPIITQIRAHTPQEFGDLVHHSGEELIYVIEGRVEVHTDLYDTVILEQGDLMYLDSTMGHAYLVADGCEEAVVLGVCSSHDEDLMDSLMNLHGQPEALAKSQAEAEASQK